MADLRDLAEQLEQLGAAAERFRQQRRARPAYRDRWQGSRHSRLEQYARRLLREARPGRWLRFYAADAHDAAAVDQCLAYIIRQERPAESVRVEWLRRDGSWRLGFPRPRDRRGHGDAVRTGRQTREAVAAISGRAAAGASAFDGRELARLERVQSSDGSWWYAGRLRLGPKRGTVPPPALPRARRPAADVLGDALAGWS